MFTGIAKDIRLPEYETLYPIIPRGACFCSKYTHNSQVGDGGWRVSSPRSMSHPRGLQQVYFLQRISGHIQITRTFLI